MFSLALNTTSLPICAWAASSSSAVVDTSNASLTELDMDNDWGDGENSNTALDITKYDPYEQENRRVYKFNNKFDRKIVTRLLKGYRYVAPSKTLRTCIYQAMENLNEPLYTLNFLLQGNLPGALRSLARFTLNTTLGFFGFFDAGSKHKLPPNPNYFGMTLAHYGAVTGSYVVMPLWGPRTSQSTAGLILDIGFNPLDYIIYPSIFSLLLAKAFTLLTKRDMADEAITQIQSMSTDEYSTVRSLFVQSEMVGRPECRYK